MRSCGDFANERGQVPAKERFAAGEADLFDTEGDEDADDAQVVGQGQFAVLGAVVAGAAVDAAVVAAVRHGDAQVSDGAAVAVGQASGSDKRSGCGSGRDGLGGRHRNSMHFLFYEEQPVYE